MKNKRKGFTLMELLIVVAIIAILVAIAILTFGNQLEKSREATDLANVRSEYAKVMTAAASDDKTADFNNDGNADYSSSKGWSSTVNLIQKQDGWTTSVPIIIGGIQSGDDGGTNDDKSWIGSPKGNGMCTISCTPDGKVVLDWSGTSDDESDDSPDSETCTVTIINNSTYTLSYNGNSYGSSQQFSFSVKKGSAVKKESGFISTLSIDGNTISASFASNLSWSVADGDTVNSDCTISASGSCILSETLVMLADGSLKRIDDITTSDRLMTFNFYTGSPDGNYPMYVLKHEDKESVVITVTLENDTVLEMCDWQQFFDIDTKEYFDIDSVNYRDAIGKNIMFISSGSVESVRIADVTAEVRCCTSYEIFTEYNKNFTANGIVTIEPETWLSGVYTITDELTIDMDQYQTDAAVYGLYSYHQFSDLMSEDQFNKMNIAAKKIAVGKGLVSEQWLFDLYRDWMPVYEEIIK